MDFGLRKPAAATDASAVIKDSNSAGFTKDVIEASRSALVLVDFWADWCGPCKQLTPILEKVVKSYGGKVRLVKINVDQNRPVATQLGIQSLPTVFAFKDGRGLDGFAGALPESGVKAFIDRLLGNEAGEPDLAEALKAGDDALEAGDLQGAAEIFASVLEEDKQNVPAITGLARCYLKSGDATRAEQTLSLVPPEKQSSALVLGLKAAIDLARKTEQVGDTAALEQKLASNPADHQARLDLAMALAAKGDKPGAIGQLLDLFRRDRKWNDEAARKQMVQFFEAWGPKDPSTLEGRRRLSSMMFS